MISGLIGNIQEFASDQTKVQRYCAAASDKEARWAVWFTGLACIPVWALFMFVGTCLYVFYGVVEDAAVQAGMKADQVFPHFILTQLPVGLGGFVIAAVLAAAMSSIDSSMNGTATVLSVDIYRRLLVKDKDDKHYLFVARLLTTLGGCFMIVVACLITLIDADSLLYIGFVIGSVMAGGLGGVFILGFFSTRTNSKGIAIGVVAALLMIFYLTLSQIDNMIIEAETKTAVEEKLSALADAGELGENGKPSEKQKQAVLYEAEAELAESEKGLRLLPDSLRSKLHPFLIGVLSNLTAFVIGYLASFFFPKPSDEKLYRATWWTRYREET